MNKLLCVLSFAAGAATGAIVMHRYIYDSYMKKTQEEVDSVREAFEKRYEELKKEGSETLEKMEDATKKMVEAARNKPGIVEYTERIKKEGYVDYAKTTKDGQPAEEEEVVERPIVISPDVFGEDEDYATISLTYYEGDDVLTDEDDNIVDDVAGIVGTDFADHFGQYEEDSVYIQNDMKKCYYEILRTYTEYEAVVQKKPKPVEIKENEQGDD